jgi:hypothetical protein
MRTIHSPNLFRKKFLNPSLWATFCVALVACDGGNKGAAPETTQRAIESHLPGLIASASESIATMESNLAWDGFIQSMEAIDLLFFQEEDSIEPLPASFGEDESDEFTEDIVEFLNTELFIAENYEGDGVYRIPAELLCDEVESYDSSTGEYEWIVDQECIDNINLIEPRVLAESIGEELDLSLLIGPDRAAPLSLELRSDRISLAADFAEAKAALEHVLEVTGEGEEIGELPNVMQGVIAATFRVNAPQDVSFELAIREALQIEGSFAGEDIRFSSAEADPLAALRINGIADTVVASIDVNRTQLSMPWSMLDEESNATGTFALDWQGWSASLDIGESVATNQLVIRNVGFGDGQSTAKLDEHTLLAVDLNADTGRHFDLFIEPAEAAGLPTFRFEENFKLEVMADLSPLAAAGDEVPAFLLGETYTLEVEDSMLPVEGLYEGGLQAVGGSIRFGSSAGGTIVVAEGECLIASEVEPDEHEVLGAFAAGPCPI